MHSKIILNLNNYFLAMCFNSIVFIMVVVSLCHSGVDTLMWLDIWWRNNSAVLMSLMTVDEYLFI